MKKMRFFIFGFLILFSFVSFAASPISISRKATVKQIQVAFKNGQSAEDPSQQAYQLSLPLFAAALINKRPLYQTILPAMENALSKNEPTTTTAWLYGRLLVSAKLMNNSAVLERVKKKMMTMLSSENIQGSPAMRAWAWAYLASIYPPRTTKPFNIAKKYFLSALDAQIEEHGSKSDLMWSITMGMVAGGKHFDVGFYRLLLTKYLSVALGTDSLEIAIRQVPVSDYRVWLVADLRMATKLIKDEDTYKLLAYPLKQSYRLTQDPNALMMARATEWRYQQ